MAKIGILDYGMGNLPSVVNALDYLGVANKIVTHPDNFREITHLIIPGVGSFAQAMNNIQQRKFITPIKEWAKTQRPLLGICLGMQLLAEIGTEPYKVLGLGLIPGSVSIFANISLHIPHIGWNGVKYINEHPMLESVKKKADFYFVHSYHFNCTHKENIIGVTDYGYEFPSIISNKHGNVIGTQFHPEKSQKQGIKLLDNFINL